MAVLVTVISASLRAGAAPVTAFHHAFFTAAGLMAIAALLALTIRDADAAATMRRRERVPAVAAPPAEVPPPHPGVTDPLTTPVVQRHRKSGQEQVHVAELVP